MLWARINIQIENADCMTLVYSPNDPGLWRSEGEGFSQWKFDGFLGPLPSMFRFSKTQVGMRALLQVLPATVGIAEWECRQRCRCYACLSEISNCRNGCCMNIFYVQFEYVVYGFNRRDYTLAVFSPHDSYRFTNY